MNHLNYSVRLFLITDTFKKNKIQFKDRDKKGIN